MNSKQKFIKYFGRSEVSGSLTSGICDVLPDTLDFYGYHQYRLHHEDTFELSHDPFEYLDIISSHMHLLVFGE